MPIAPAHGVPAATRYAGHARIGSLASAEQMSEQSPLELLEERREAAQAAAALEDKLGNWSGWAHHVCGVAGIIGGALAATAAGGGWPTWVAVLGGVLAAVGSGVATVFNYERRSGLHWERAAELQSVADLAQNERARLGPDARDDAANALTKVQARLDAARLDAARIPSAIHPDIRIGDGRDRRAGDRGG